MPGSRHHYIPRMLLNGFSPSNNKKVWYYYKDREPRLVSTKDIGVSKNFYHEPTRGINQDVRISSAEHSQLDLIQKLRTDPDLKFSHKDIFYLMILLAVRGDAFKDEMSKGLRRAFKRRSELLKSNEINELKVELNVSRRVIEYSYKYFNWHFGQAYGISFDKYLYDLGSRLVFLNSYELSNLDKEFLIACEVKDFQLFAIYYFTLFDATYKEYDDKLQTTELEIDKFTHLQMIDYFQSHNRSVIKSLIPDEDCLFDYYQQDYGNNHYLILGDYITSIIKDGEITKLSNPAALYNADAFLLPLSYNQLFFGNRGGIDTGIEKINEETARNSSKFFISPYDTPECRKYHKLIGQKSDTSSDFKFDDMILGKSEYSGTCDRIYDILLKISKQVPK